MKDHLQLLVCGAPAVLAGGRCWHGEGWAKEDGTLRVMMALLHSGSTPFPFKSTWKRFLDDTEKIHS